MANVNYVITVKVSWWVRWLCLPTLQCFFWFVRSFINLEAEPDMEKVYAVVKKGIKLYADGRRIPC